MSAYTSHRTLYGIGPGGWDKNTLANMQRPLTGLALVAKAYRSLVHSPTNALVLAAYAALTEELWQQFEVLSKAYTFVFTDVDPYGSSGAMFAELDMVRTLRVYTVVDMPADHPFARLAPNGQTFNSIFRAVHDALAHYPNRYSFSAAGELAAFREHCRFLSPLARWAVATETLGQNAYYQTHKRYAPQIADLLPAVLVDDAIKGRINV